MNTTDNFRKHTTKSKAQRFLIDRFLHTVTKTLRPLQPDSILDVGAGEGFTLATLKQRHIGKKLEGLEYLESAIALGKKYNPSIHLRQGTIYSLPYKDNAFDVVLCTEVLEHLEEPQKALKELVRVSKKYLILSVPNEPFFIMANFLRGKNLSRWGNDIEHINHWTFFGFKNFVGKYAKIISVQYPFPWTLILAEKR